MSLIASVEAIVDDSLILLILSSKKNKKKAATYSPTPIRAVPSALKSLTSLFGMVRGDPPRYSHLSLLMWSFHSLEYRFDTSSSISLVFFGLVRFSETIFAVEIMIGIRIL